MKKRLTLLFAIAVLGVGASAPSAFADNPVRVAQEETETDTGEDDGGSDYGWIGLLGLAGLAGLLRRDKRRDDVRVDRTTTGTGPGGTTRP